MTIFAVFVGIVAYGQNSSYGNVCDQAIYVDSTLNQMIEPNETYFFTVNTEDLPLVVYFFPDEEGASEPQVYVDLTCIAGVYEDENVRDIVDFAAAYDVYFPLSLPFDQLFVDGKTVYRVNYDRSLLDLLSLLGVDYSIPVYVAVKSEVSGSVQVENKRTVSQCYDRCLRVEMQDTLYLKANEENLFYFPVKEWKGNNLSFTWTGDKDYDKTEMPYEKFLKYGPESLSEAELLAIILRTGTKDCNSVELGKKILDLPVSPHKGLLGLHHVSVEELKRIRGIGEVKAVKIKCIAELSRRISKASQQEKLSFRKPESVAEYYMEEFRMKKQEHMMLIMLNTKSRLIAEKIIFKGTVNASIVSPREIFVEAVNQEAVYIILLHNHPSGDPTPSHQDIFISKKIKEAGELLDISLVDHIIIGDNIYVSLKEKNLL